MTAQQAIAVQKGMLSVRRMGVHDGGESKKGFIHANTLTIPNLPNSYAKQGYTSVCIKSNSDWSKRSALDGNAWNHFPYWVNDVELRIP